MPLKKIELELRPRPHTEAALMLRRKVPVLREVFDQLSPELRIRAFTISGVTATGLIQKVRDRIASIPEEHASWEDARTEITSWLKDWMGPVAARRRAELLLRTHLFQAYQAANWRAMQEDPSAKFMQYLATEDDRVRDTHRALNGLILPKTDPFWDTHFPPWEWGCRCRARVVTDFEADIVKGQDQNNPPEEQRLVTGPRLERLRAGHLERGGRTFFVGTDPTKPRGEFSWTPDDLLLGFKQALDRLPPEQAHDLQQLASKVVIGNRTLSDWWDLPAATRPWRVARAATPSVEEKAREALRAGFRPEIVSAYRVAASRLGIAPDLIPTKAQKAIAWPFHIKMKRDPTDWHGHVDTLHHELGHVWFFKMLRNQRQKVLSELHQAMQADRRVFRQWADKNFPGWEKTWRFHRILNTFGKLASSFGAKVSVETLAQRFYAVTDFSKLEVERQRRVISYTDTVAALFRGRFGYGHQRSYWAKSLNPEHEIVANFSAAYFRGDRFLFELLPNIAAWWRKWTQLP